MFTAVLSVSTAAAKYVFDRPAYGDSYYHEYKPSNRIDMDIEMMKELGITTVRVGESPWGKFEPNDGKFELEWMDTILDKLHAAKIQVILGTPTYSIPAWMAHKYLEVLSQKANGVKSHYDIRQNMDITNPLYKNEWERYNRKRVAEFLNWQCEFFW